jgi:predicted nucleic acid-binding protein
MTRVFADAVYWVALASPHDQWHGRAVLASRALGTAQVITTEEVFVEFLAHFSGYGRLAREGAILYFDTVINHPSVLVRPQSHQSFLDGYALYKARPDKEYSLTDCISMQAMRQEGITDILTHDSHFTQEGFTILL